MRRTTLLFSALLILLAACTPRVWYKPGATSTQRDRDLQACRYEAEARFAETTPPVDAFRVYVDVPYGTPYELEREVEEAAHSAVQSAYQNYENAFVHDYVTDCMHAKGYVLVKQR